MDLRNQQIKDTYANLTTIGTVAGSPTTGTLQNGQGTNVTALTIDGDLSATNVSATSLTGTLATAAQTNITSVGTLSGLGVSGTTGLDGAVTINESGANVDFRVEGDTDQNLLFVDASTDRVGIGTSTPTASKLHIDAGSVVPTSGHVIRLDTSATTAYNSGAFVGGQIRLNYGDATNSYGGINFSNFGVTSQEFIGVVQNSSGYGDFVFQGFNGSWAERLRITSSGNVGIGATPLVKFDTKVETDTHIGFAGTAEDEAIILAFNDAGTRSPNLSYAATSHKFLSGATEIVQVTSDTYVRLSSSSAGLQFNGDTAAANALDDYDSGTYTATLTPSTSGTITLNSSVNTLAFTKIGRMMTIQGAVDVSSVSSPVGHISLSLPTAIADLSEQAERGGFLIPIRNGSSNMYNYFALCIAGESAVRIYKIGTTDFTDDSAQTFSGNETIYVNFSYISA